MADKTKRIADIFAAMESFWDLPADCNEGELFAYAETLYDRIENGDSQDALYAYLAGVQVGSLEMPRSDAYKTIVDRAIALVRNPG